MSSQHEVEWLRSRAADARHSAALLANHSHGLAQALTRAASGLTPATWTGRSARQRGDELGDAAATLAGCEADLAELADALVALATRLDLHADEAQQLLVLEASLGG